ncbi:MAG TPA: nucleotide sugar dehydrogenase [Vicinamibacterales bacterium]|nr:nucleotide sugar dehydrogenase [Vicinamibacterales bacterium]
MHLKEKLEQRQARVGVIGLGYVGLPLAVEFAKAGFDVTGFDVDDSKVTELNAGRSYILDVKTEDIAACVKAGRLRATTDMSKLGEMDAVDICVPTPLRKTKDPDMSYVVSAAEEIAKYIHPGMLIVLESTTYPGTTAEVLQPMFEARGLTVGEDFYLAFSPERVDPANEKFNTRNTPKVVGGTTPACSEVAAALYSVAVDTVVPVSSTQVAEMVKLLENTFRAVNIGLVNEIALMSHRMKIDVWEVIDAAKTKPFGFMPFYPGPGLGGHCIPIDPFYLSWKAKQSGFECRFIELAGHVNGSMPEYVVERISEALNTRKKAVNGARIHLFGIAYKKDVSDMRESPALDILQLLHRRGAELSYTDPYVPSLQEGPVSLRSIAEDAVDGIDCAVIATDHKVFDYAVMPKRFPLIVDTRNALKGNRANNIFRL